ncbi:Transcriptional activator HlyU [Pseudoalteromonas holothuriae]|uniref:Transcriptional activator HlyU n=1 Tax=Pseudoalteromonas holothuriae TaxID=2963714 RepID=A0A9W4VUH8_9GAMM|nr:MULTISPECIES: metalloregulator ArsR/SmtB family transcription factor [unclassified Pseudoalteromonas]CAH9064431.1 Transcriptional activator HlyU [Pseudoalteromonas sp. CIP111854]CAH9065385.1 Transcriptional activator HlyU [Pseudoalteromonas sp. CIP111951]
MDFEAMAHNAEQAEALLKMMANKNRLMILCSLLEKEMSVGALNEAVPLAQSALSQHLASLRKAEVVSTRRDGQTIYYRVTDEKVKAILGQLYQLFCAP